MKIFRTIATLSVTLIILLSLTSCSFFSSEVIRFGGGTLLDKEMIESIKQNVLSETSTAEDEDSRQIIDVRTDVTDEETNVDTEAESEGDKAGSSETNVEETGTSPDKSESALDNSDPTETVNNEETVYWTEGGSVWHLSVNCHHLKSTTIYSGYIKDAIDAKKTKLCSYCEKHYQD